MTLKRWIKKTWFGNLPDRFRAFKYFGTKVYFPRNSFVFEIACNFGIYEWDNLRVMQAFVRPQTLFLDVGANIGLMAVPLLAQNPKLRVHSLEPSPNSLPYLQRTAANSVFKDRWTVTGKAVGNESRTIEFFVSSKRMGAFDGMRDTDRVRTNGKVDVQMTTIDREWETSGRPAVSVIKIDVEGAEALALEGGILCIENNQPAILVEWNASNLEAFQRSPEWLLDFAKRMGYSIFSIPSVGQVVSAASLRAHMALSESFCLLPETEVGVQLLPNRAA